MILRPSRKSVLALLTLVASLSSCDQDEIVPLDDVIFKINISDEFIVNHHQYVLIISDYEGEVLVTKKLNTRGTHELEVPGRADGVYHLTIFDGDRSFKTYASVPPDEFFIDFPHDVSYGPVGKHSIFLQDPSVGQPLITGSDLQYINPVSKELLEMNLTNTTSDLYILYDKNSEPRFLYYPSVGVNQSTTITAANFASGGTMKKIPVTFLPGVETPNITLSGSIEPDSKRMEYYLSNSNLDPHVQVPESMLPRLKFFTTTFVDGGNGYAYVGPEIATQQKALNAVVGDISLSESSVFYSIESAGSRVEWQGWSPTMNWSIVSQPGINLKVNLPRLSQEFQNGYELGDLQTLKFLSARVQKDTRYAGYQEYVKAMLKNEYPVMTTAFEQFDQFVPL